MKKLIFYFNKKVDQDSKPVNKCRCESMPGRFQCWFDRNAGASALLWPCLALTPVPA